MKAFRFLRPSKSEKEFTDKVSKSFITLKVEGRGTVFVDVKEVIEDKNFQNQLLRARNLVKQ